MEAPTYRWICHQCGAANEPGIAHCTSCSSPAVVSGRALQPAPTDTKSAHRQQARTNRFQTLWPFFPEILIAAAIVIASPLWGARLMVDGHYAAGAVLLTGMATGLYAFFRFAIRRQRWHAYFSVLGILLVAYMLHSATH